MTSTWMMMAKMKRKKERHHEQQGEQTLQGRGIATQPGANDVRHGFDHRLASSVDHGHGPGGLAAQGHRGDRRATASRLSEGSAGPSGEVTPFGSRGAGHLSG